MITNILIGAVTAWILWEGVNLTAWLLNQPSNLAVIAGLVVPLVMGVAVVKLIIWRTK